MKEKKLPLLPTILALIVFFSVSLLFSGCHLTGIKSTEQEADEEELERLEAEMAAIEEAEKFVENPTEVGKEPQAEEIEHDQEATAIEEITEEDTSSEENSFPNKPVTYEGNIENGYPITVILIVDFTTANVAGSLSCCGEGLNTYVDATITNGKINVDTLEITTNYSGVAGSKAVEGSEGAEIPISGTITGIITDDLTTFNGEMKSEEGAQKFTAARR
jgi:hypothetical protein